jgi:hypothetical protein|tara:strand:- start:225 stop:494 length:270 start_codon:yes stop_codon:yes gene_type:complete
MDFVSVFMLVAAKATLLNKQALSTKMSMRTLSSRTVSRGDVIVILQTHCRLGAVDPSFNTKLPKFSHQHHAQVTNAPTMPMKKSLFAKN